MKSRILPAVVSLSAICFLMSCASAASRLPATRVHWESRVKIGGARLGIMPIQCYPPDVGNMISDVIASSLKDDSIEVIDRRHMTALLQNEGLSPREAVQRLGYEGIGSLCDVRCVLDGTAVVTTYQKKFVRPGGVVSTEFRDVRIQIVDVTSGEPVMNASIDQLQRQEWHRPEIIGEALAVAIKQELGDQKLPQSGAK